MLPSFCENKKSFKYKKDIRKLFEKLDYKFSPNHPIYRKKISEKKLLYIY